MYTQNGALAHGIRTGSYRTPGLCRRLNAEVYQVESEGADKDITLFKYRFDEHPDMDPDKQGASQAADGPFVPHAPPVDQVVKVS